MRQIVLDTETTGLEAKLGHRIIEIGCVELVNRRPSGRHFHHYLNPDRDIDEGARAVHGISREQLLGKPRFGEVAAQLLEFIRGAELVIHNAAFDLEFLDMEFARLPADHLAPERPAAVRPAAVRDFCGVLDTLLLAREMHPGQRNTLDALCKRYGVDNSHRDLHGALLDARILADVYLAMTGGQNSLALGESARPRGTAAVASEAVVTLRRDGRLPVIVASEAEVAAHAQLQQLLDKESKGACLWRRLA
jgi:DNA polymerase-3 subunit epsilon